MVGLPYIPETIVVHLGPPDSPAENVTVPFSDYIKNVASSEIYSTWPEEAIRANLYAQISYALNRYYTEWYRSKGYPFDITSSTQYDQKFIPGRSIFSNISDLVDEVFNRYLRREGTVNPLFAAYCNGTTTTCGGLSQWGTVPLAEAGLSAMDIIHHYYGDDVELVTNVPTDENVPSYPGVPLRLRDFNENVRWMQVALNRISSNYPAIPKIPQADGAFGQSTQDAVTAFQRIFQLTADGVIGQATWYKIISIYNAVKRLSELTSEGVRYAELPRSYQRQLRRGDSGGAVLELQYFLSFIAEFDDAVPSPSIDGVYGAGTEEAVRSFQRARGLTADGVAGRATWNAIHDAYRGIIAYLYGEETVRKIEPYPGTVLKRGMSGPSVQLVQQELSYISRFLYEIAPLPDTGYFGARTEDSVERFQELFGLPVTGMVDEATWDRIGEMAAVLVLGDQRLEGQFPGYIIEGR